MHEVALSSQIARIVSRAAAGRDVERVTVTIGALRQVVPETLQYAWGFVTRATALEGAVLDVEWVPATIRCPAGHLTTLSGEFAISCPQCGQRGHIIQGEDFAVRSIDVRGTSAPPPT